MTFGLWTDSGQQMYPVEVVKYPNLSAETFNTT